MRRIFEVLAALVLLLATAPLMLLLWLLIRFDDGAPSTFRQARAGQHGEPFEIRKFRTLRRDAPTDQVIAEGDPRILRSGRLLRRYRLDELPQLFAVLTGRLALVGPRPETQPDLQCLSPAERTAFLSIRPGLTGPVQLQFIAEDAWLEQSANPTRDYRELLIPAKVTANLEAFASQSVSADIRCLLQTLIVLGSSAARRRSREFLDATLPRRR